MKKEDKRVVINLEYEIKCSPNLLFNYLSTSTGLQEWFAKKVNNKKNGEFEFEFEGGSISKAILIKNIPNKLVRFQWENAPKDEFLELEIIVDELTDDVAIKITEYCSETEKRELEELWHAQIDGLKHALGS